MPTLSSSSPVRSALVVHAHPEPRSFSSAQARAVVERLRSEGVDVRSIDLYADGWDPVLAPGQFLDGPDYFKPQAEQLRALAAGSLAHPVDAHLEQLQQADLLVLSFPLWWFSMPAIMKGWVDRVFVMGGAFGGRHGIFAEGGLRGKKAMLLVTTGGAEASFSPDASDGYGSLDTFLFHIHRGMLEFVGYDVLPPVVTYGPRVDREDDRPMLDADDRDQITQTLALLAYVTDEDQLDRLDELFVPDAVYDMSRSGMGTFEGLDAVRSAASRLRASGHAPIAHFVTNVVVDEREEGTAAVRSRGLMIMHDGKLHAVTYDDTLRRRDGRWRIALRVITPLHPSSDG